MVSKRYLFFILFFSWAEISSAKLPRVKIQFFSGVVEISHQNIHDISGPDDYKMFAT